MCGTTEASSTPKCAERIEPRNTTSMTLTQPSGGASARAAARRAAVGAPLAGEYDIFASYFGLPLPRLSPNCRGWLVVENPWWRRDKANAASLTADETSLTPSDQPQQCCVLAHDSITKTLPVAGARTAPFSPGEVAGYLLPARTESRLARKLPASPPRPRTVSAKYSNRSTIQAVTEVALGEGNGVVCHR